MGTPRFTYGGTDFARLLKVAAWVGGSAFAAALVEQLKLVDWSAVFGENSVFAVAVVNVIAFAAAQFLGDTRE